MKTKKRKASASVLIVLIVAILLIVSVTFAAIFRQSVDYQRLFSVSNFKAQSVVTFDGVTNMTPYQKSYGILASVDPSKPNYLGNLRAKVTYSGRGVGLIRVRVAEEWSTPFSDTVTVEGGSPVTTTGRMVQPYQVEVPYTIASPYNTGGSANQAAWFDNRANDYCFYFATPVYGSNSGTSEISLITGLGSMDLAIMPLDTEVVVMIEADVVQVNRYPQYWGISALPWNASALDKPENATELAIASS